MDAAEKKRKDEEERLAFRASLIAKSKAEADQQLCTIAVKTSGANLLRSTTPAPFNHAESLQSFLDAHKVPNASDAGQKLSNLPWEYQYNVIARGQCPMSRGNALLNRIATVLGMPRDQVEHNAHTSKDLNGVTSDEARCATGTGSYLPPGVIPVVPVVEPATRIMPDVD